MKLLEQYRGLAEALLWEAHKFYTLQYQRSDGGNLSVRIPGTAYMIVKGSNVDFGSLSLDTLVIADFAGQRVEGNGKPSKESLLHGAIYREFAQIGAIMHCHSPWATAWAARHEELLMATHHAGIKLGGLCPVFDTHSYVVPEEHFAGILDILRQHPQMKSFLLRGHGQVALGADMRDAALTAELVEETAMIAQLSGLSG
ncbi:MAG: class II aldolase/adducin family protein [Clostridiales bacterium]|nr:class II aldolase/adducin family protein [Clostridiales bacterium]